MEWDMASWGLEEVEGGVEPTSVGIGSVVAPSSGPKSGSDCSVDLKLGGFGCSQVRGEQQRVAAVPGTSKRPRTPGGGSQSAACMVEGCAADLSSSKEYHRRHKVCEVHSKTPVVMVGGQEQRFCQQCSRFHLLGEFDEVKRSCRKRLDGHNRRRRKPQPEPLTVSRFLLNFQDPRYPPVPAIRSTATLHPGWTSEMKIGDGGHASPFYGMQQFAPFNPNSFKEGKPNPFSQGISATVSSGTMIGGTSSVRHPFLDCFSFSEGSGGSSKIFSDGLSQVLDSDCALSLLSSPTLIPSINLGRVVSANHVPMSQPLPQGSRQHCDVGQASNKVLDTGFTCPDTDGNPVNTVTISHAGNADIHCHGMLHVSEGSTNGSLHALPFSWQ